MPREKNITTVYADADSVHEGEGQVFETEYVSLVNSGTYGKPALVAPDRGEGATARPGEEVLYVNTSLVPVFRIKRPEGP
jgi:hypothetical protein